jgi:uncharacterized protein with GYD domain
MPAYVLLMKMTAKGAADMKNAPQRVADSLKLWDKMGGSLKSIHITMGPYDYVGIGEAPDDETAAAFAMAMSASGNVTTTSMRAFTPDEFAALASRLP